MKQFLKNNWPIALVLAFLILAGWDIYSWADSLYWKGISDSRRYMLCKKQTGWEQDFEKMRHKHIGSCAELETVINGYDKPAEEVSDGK